jgi:hypothetical protein
LTVFVAVMRSGDGLVRVLLLTVTGRDTWRGTGMRLIGHMSQSRFDAKYGPTAWGVARAENEAGCWDAHP